MEFLIGCSLFVVGALLNRLALKSSLQRANMLALMGAAIFLPAFCGLIVFTNARPAGPAGDTPAGMLLLFWALAFGAGLAFHKWTFKKI
ncbi:MAG: hypothetical protein Kow0031_39690 [Anaerolineae bacterium]